MAYRPKNTQERIIHRLKISKGHLEKVIKMLEEDAYCIDVLHQMNAVQSGLKETGNIVLENHLKGCVSALRYKVTRTKVKDDIAIGGN